MNELIDRSFGVGLNVVFVWRSAPYHCLKDRMKIFLCEKIAPRMLMVTHHHHRESFFVAVS